MITALVLLLGLVLIAKLFCMGSDARRSREVQERLEDHVKSQLPKPAGFEDIPDEAVAAVRAANDIGAIVILHKQGVDLDTAKLRIKELSKALEAGPALGRPPSRTGVLNKLL